MYSWKISFVICLSLSLKACRSEHIESRNRILSIDVIDDKTHDCVGCSKYVTKRAPLINANVTTGPGRLLSNLTIDTSVFKLINLSREMRGKLRNTMSPMADLLNNLQSGMNKLLKLNCVKKALRTVKNILIPNQATRNTSVSLISKLLHNVEERNDNTIKQCDTILSSVNIDRFPLNFTDNLHNIKNLSSILRNTTRGERSSFSWWGNGNFSQRVMFLEDKGTSNIKAFRRQLDHLTKIAPRIHKNYTSLLLSYKRIIPTLVIASLKEAKCGRNPQGYFDQWRKQLINNSENQLPEWLLLQEVNPLLDNQTLCNTATMDTTTSSFRQNIPQWLRRVDEMVSIANVYCPDVIKCVPRDTETSDWVNDIGRRVTVLHGVAVRLEERLSGLNLDFLNKDSKLMHQQIDKLSQLPRSENSLNTCSDNKDCTKCISNEWCGWCDETKKCLDGSIDAIFFGTCSRKWLKKSCTSSTEDEKKGIKGKNADVLHYIAPEDLARPAGRDRLHRAVSGRERGMECERKRLEALLERQKYGLEWNYDDYAKDTWFQWLYNDPTNVTSMAINSDKNRNTTKGSEAIVFGKLKKIIGSIEPEECNLFPTPSHINLPKIVPEELIPHVDNPLREKPIMHISPFTSIVPQKVLSTSPTFRSPGIKGAKYGSSGLKKKDNLIKKPRIKQTRNFIPNEDINIPILQKQYLENSQKKAMSDVTKMAQEYMPPGRSRFLSLSKLKIPNTISKKSRIFQPNFGIYGSKYGSDIVENTTGISDRHFSQEVLHHHNRNRNNSEWKRKLFEMDKARLHGKDGTPEDDYILNAISIFQEGRDKLQWSKEENREIIARRKEWDNMHHASVAALHRFSENAPTIYTTSKSTGKSDDMRLKSTHSNTLNPKHTKALEMPAYTNGFSFGNYDSAKIFCERNYIRLCSEDDLLNAYVEGYRKCDTAGWFDKPDKKVKVGVQGANADGGWDVRVCNSCGVYKDEECVGKRLIMTPRPSPMPAFCCGGKKLVESTAGSCNDKYHKTHADCTLDERCCWYQPPDRAAEIGEIARCETEGMCSLTPVKASCDVVYLPLGDKVGYTAKDTGKEMQISHWYQNEPKTFKTCTQECESNISCHSIKYCEKDYEKGIKLADSKMIKHHGCYLYGRVLLEDSKISSTKERECKSYYRSNSCAKPMKLDKKKEKSQLQSKSTDSGGEKEEEKWADEEIQEDKKKYDKMLEDLQILGSIDITKNTKHFDNTPLVEPNFCAKLLQLQSDETNEKKIKLLHGVREKGCTSIRCAILVDNCITLLDKHK